MSSPERTPAPKRRLTRRHWALASLVALPAGIYLFSWLTFPSDKTPEGAYLRIVRAVNRGQAEEFFAYTEEAAQHACFTIGDYRKKSLEVARRDFPADRLAEMEKDYGALARAEHGRSIFALMVAQEGWLDQMRLDVSGISKIDVEGQRATVETSKGTRYSMRVRPNGIWGLTAFTPTLVEEAERAARDFEQVEKAAADFSRVKKAAAQK